MDYRSKPNNHISPNKQNPTFYKHKSRCMGLLWRQSCNDTLGNQNLEEADLSRRQIWIRMRLGNCLVKSVEHTYLSHLPVWIIFWRCEWIMVFIFIRNGSAAPGRIWR